MNSSVCGAAPILLSSTCCCSRSAVLVNVARYSAVQLLFHVGRRMMPCSLVGNVEMIVLSLGFHLAELKLVM